MGAYFEPLVRKKVKKVEFPGNFGHFHRFSFFQFVNFHRVWNIRHFDSWLRWYFCVRYTHKKTENNKLSLPIPNVRFVIRVDLGFDGRQENLNRHWRHHFSFKSNDYVRISRLITNSIQPNKFAGLWSPLAFIKMPFNHF